jgi:hypothetical protein
MDGRWRSNERQSAEEGGAFARAEPCGACGPVRLAQAQAQRKERLRRLAAGLANVVKLRERLALSQAELSSRRTELTSRREQLRASAAELPPASRAVAAARHRCKEVRYPYRHGAAGGLRWIPSLVALLCLESRAGRTSAN